MTPMQFECDSCHARYRISDEKVRGRVVRFPCRKCDHKILIDGRLVDADVTVPAGAAYGFEEVIRKSEPATSFQHEAPTARGRRPSAPARRRPPSVPPPRRPAAVARKLSAAPFVATRASEGQHPGLAPPVPVSSAQPKADVSEVPQWHVSIHDVPVGPIRLEEMAHKIDAGAVSEYSLVWRDGFEEWRPLATVPELMALLHQRRVSGLPSRTSFSSVPPFVDSHAPARSRDSESEFPSLADSLQPESSFGELAETSQPPAPIGPDDVFQSSPSLGSFSGLPPGPGDAVSVPSAPPELAAATAEPRRGLSIGAVAVIVSIAVFSGVAAFLAFERYGESILTKWIGESQPTRAAVAVPKPNPASKTEPAKVELAPSEDVVAEGVEEVEAEDQASEQQGAAAGEIAPGQSNQTAVAAGDTEPKANGAQRDALDEGALAVPPPNPADDGPRIAPARGRQAEVRRKPRPEPQAAPVTNEDALDDAEEKLLREFRSSSNAGPAEISVKEASSTQSDRPPLDGEGVRATVTANKPRLQRCYERAIRGQRSAPVVRMDVTVMVASSGRVKEVSAEGSAPGGLAECIEASVRRWRFPASSEGGPAKFPIVFSAN